MSIEISVDYRERRSGIPELLRMTDAVNVTETHLISGDYKINKQWLIERKTLTDLAASIIDGRLFRQIAGMHEQNAGLKPILLLEGSSTSLASSNMRREAILGALITVTLYMNTPILRSLNAKESASLIMYIAKQQERFCHFSSINYHPVPRKPQSKNKQQIMILQSLPGVGTQRAKALLQRFGTIEQVMISSAQELMKVDGIGRKSAESIKWVLQEQRANYHLPFFDF